MSEQKDLFKPENDDVAVAEAPPPAAGGDLGGGQLPPMETLVGGGDALPLGLYAERAYLEYAVSVVKGRALPDVCDGQKPVQRRILYAMHEMGLGSTAKPVKSARVVGDVLGKYHPHGDKAAYDALVRMAQDFVMRYPLIDGQGNFGSRDGDGAAAMRYTEARLTSYANLLLAEIGQGTVDFAPNYDGSFQEPELLPARLPMLLLNGASGIAVGMATEIPSHNLKEVAAATVALIRKPGIGADELLQHVQGPDFAGGAQLISAPEAIREAYETGRGSLKLRARWTVEELARGQWQVVVGELPPGTSTQKVMEEIEEITNPKVKPGKKTLSQEQQQLRQLVLSVLETARDESGKDAMVRLVLEPRSSKLDRDEFMTLLLAHTSLESSAPVNMVMIGGDGRPRQKSLKEVLAEWVEFRFATVRRRCRHRLEQVLDRIHVLEGRIVVFLNLDKVIKLIREADEPKAELMAKFRLSERQAEDILEIRLRQLAKLERIRIEQELDNLRKEQQELEKLLSDERAMRTLIIKEIEADARAYGDARRTLIQPAERAQVSTAVVDEPVTVLFSQKGWVKTRTGHGHDPSMFAFKEGDALAAAVECRTVDNAVFFGSAGRVYTVPVAQLPGGRGDGVPVASLIELQPGTRIGAMACGKPEQRLLVATSGGFGFVCKLGDMLSRQRGGRQFVTLDKGHELLPPVSYEDMSGLQLAALSGEGRLLVFALEEMKELSGGGKGVIIMGLEPKENLVAACVVPPGARLLASGSGRGGKAQQVEVKPGQLADYAGHRARKGRALPVKLKPAGLALRLPEAPSAA